MTVEQNKQLHALLNSLGLTDKKISLVQEASGGRAVSSSDLTNEEAALLIQSLRKQEHQRTNKMKGKVIHLLCLMGYTINGQPDSLRIDDYIRNIGSRNPRKVTLSKMYPSEIREVCTQIEARYKNQLKRNV